MLLAIALFAALSAAALAQEKTVVLYTSLAPTESGPLGQAFEKKTGIKVEIWRALSEKVVQRALTEARAKRNAVDVIETNGPEMEMLAREKLFAELKSPYLADIPPAAIPKHRQWIPDRLNFFVVGYNTNKVRRDELPKDYRGFLDPKWKGRLGIEATDTEWMATLIKLWGERDGFDYFRKLADMRPDVRKGHVLLAGDAAHATNPCGGLGLTSGVWTGMVLADILGAVLRGEEDESILDRFSAERRRVFWEVVSPAATENKRMLQERDPEQRQKDLASVRALSDDPDSGAMLMLFAYKVIGDVLRPNSRWKDADPTPHVVPHIAARKGQIH
jgi:hypothetical protein